MGRPIPGSGVLIQDGELLIAGQGLCLGFEGELVEVAGQPCLRSGDRARWDGDDVVVLGRLDSVVKVAGARVDLSGLEAQLRTAGAAAARALVVDGALTCYVEAPESLDLEAVAAALPPPVRSSRCRLV